MVQNLSKNHISNGPEMAQKCCENSGKYTIFCSFSGGHCRIFDVVYCLKAVGCDLIVGSAQKVDSCGVCGGSDECSENGIFVWGEVALSHCSVPCGGGYMMARSVCQNNQTKATVQDDFCNLSHKPTSRMAPCNTHPCPAR